MIHICVYQGLPYLAAMDQISSLLHKMPPNHFLSTAERAMEGWIQNPLSNHSLSFRWTYLFSVSSIGHPSTVRTEIFPQVFKITSPFPTSVGQQIEIHQFLTRWTKKVSLEMTETRITQNTVYQMHKMYFLVGEIKGYKNQ